MSNKTNNLYTHPWLFAECKKELTELHVEEGDCTQIYILKIYLTFLSAIAEPFNLKWNE